MRISSKGPKALEINMTPMIDCVFLLLLFFMLVTDMARQDDIEDMQLPDVKAARPDENPDPMRLIINITKDGSYYIGGARRSEQEVMDALAVEARQTRDQAGISDRIVLVKADRRARFEYIKKLIIMCVDKNIRIWRLAFGTLPLGKREDADTPAASAAAAATTP